jgi:hypothetical protein
VIEAIGWIVVIAVGWLAVAVPVALVVGRGIRLAEESEPDLVDHEIERELIAMSTPGDTPGDHRW